MMNYILKISTSDILNVISDDKALALFKTIASANDNDNDSNTLRTKIKLTRKQHYSRMYSLVNVGLIKRKSGNYSLTSFGKVIYEAQRIVEDAVNNYYWKLKVIDSAQLSKEISIKEYTKLVDILIDNQKINEIMAAGSF